MIAAIPEPTEGIKLFRTDPWPFQQTFQTPLKDLPRFVSTFMAPFVLEQGALETDQVVFEPESLLRLMSSRSLHVDSCWRFILQADEHQEIARLLEAALGDWVDFVFVPRPDSFAIYADHDEYTTFYANSEKNLKKLSSALERAGFDSVVGYTRSNL